MRIVIGDDHKQARRAMRLILESDADFEIIGEAQTGDEVIAMAEQTMPDIILMDINMPGRNGLEATGIIKERLPYVKIVIVTVSDDISDLFAALKKGAQGYLLKNLDSSIWLNYLHALTRDEAPMPKEIAQRILHEFTMPQTTENQSLLTSREEEILIRVAKGRSNKEIAQELFISTYTVKNHLKNIMQKLHLHNRVALTRYAFTHGMFADKN